MTTSGFWSALGGQLTVQNLLSAFTGFAPVALTTVVVGLVIYLFRRVSKRLARGKGGA